jgi:hypothetical protein
MRKIIAIAATSIVVLAASTAAPVTAKAGNGDVAAGIIGGLAAGAILGAAIGPHPAFGAAYEGAPVYGPPDYDAPSCYWAPGRPYWDGYRWERSRVRVCD